MALIAADGCCCCSAALGGLIFAGGALSEGKPGVKAAGNDIQRPAAFITQWCTGYGARAGRSRELVAHTAAAKCLQQSTTHTLTRPVSASRPSPFPRPVPACLPAYPSPQERLEREYNLDLVTTAPTVVYKCMTTDGNELTVNSPADLPEATKRNSISEPYVRCALCNVCLVGDVVIYRTRVGYCYCYCYCCLVP